jgi:hypothetical protein
MATVGSFPHRVTRLVFDAGQPYERFRGRYEAAVPPADPLLYSPLRALIYIDSADRTRFAVDRPSTIFAGFADPAIARLGVDLDHQLAELLTALGVEATEVL